TGGGRGIGAAIARALRAHGARVTVLGRDLAALDRIAAEIGAQAFAIDITDEASVSGAFLNVGAADILINNAGAAESAPIERTDAALWERMLAVNLSGAFLCTQHVLPGMRAAKWGRIVNIASTAALKGYPYVTAYCAAKHGLLGFTRALALEVKRDGVTVNAVCPGFTETDLLADSIAEIQRVTGRTAEQARAQLLKDTPHGKFATPEEVAAAVVQLCLPSAAATTGEAIVIEGGAPKTP
ncbi:MAG: 3-hydroxyacyl-CoA dehydrogenase, partial [Opitutus sp.]|nr:3-hydroxyacyl-CoA dehydrogenase [Opitutus sp.]